MKTNQRLFGFQIYFMSMNVLLTQIYTSEPCADLVHAWCAQKSNEGVRSLGNRSYRWGPSEGYWKLRALKRANTNVP